MLLETRDLRRSFGGLKAVDGVSLRVDRGEIVAVIGPNGSGKTTLFNTISGVIPATGGQVLFKGENITGLRPHEITRRGIARTFQTIRLFRTLPVFENVLVGRHVRNRTGIWDAIFRTGRQQAEARANREKVDELLAFVGLDQLRDVPAASLPYGAQRRLEIARALATEPDLLLLDEPAAGMNPTETDELLALIGRVRDRGTAVLLIEHQMRLVMSISQRVIVLDHGNKIAEGPPAAVQQDPRVIQAYLGTELE